MNDPIHALAREAVDAISSYFYDYDDAQEAMGTEWAACPVCRADIPNLSDSCPECGARFDEPVSKNAQVYREAVEVVETAIRRALTGEVTADGEKAVVVLDHHLLDEMAGELVFWDVMADPPTDLIRQMGEYVRAVVTAAGILEPEQEVEE
jgi:hypothetical protein